MNEKKELNCIKIEKAKNNRIKEAEDETMTEGQTWSPLVLSRDPQEEPKQADWKTLLLSLDLPFLPLDDDAEAPPQYALLPLDPISPDYHSTQNDTQITSQTPKSFNL